MRGLAPFARPHWRWFLKGAIAALAVVAAKLSLPWPLRAVADRWVSPGAATEDGLLALVPIAFDPVIAMGLLFLALVFMLGFSDFLERGWFARFAIATVDDLRTQALASAVADRRRFNAADLVTRFVADSPLIRSGVQGFLVHVATSGILFVGITVVLFSMDAMLGLIFSLAGAATLMVTGWAAAKIFRNTLLRRAKEGEFANQIQAAIDNASDDEDDEPPQINRTGGRFEASQTRLQGIATWTTHGIFGTAVLAALWVGSDAVATARMSAGDLVVFMMYALMLQSPIIRLARQGAKTGKIFGAAYRLLQVFPQRRG